MFVCWCTCARLSRGCVSRRHPAVCDLLCSTSLSVWVPFHANACTWGHRTRKLLCGAVGHTDLKHRILGLPGGPVIKTPNFQCRRRGFDSLWGNYIPHVQAKKKKNKTILPQKVTHRITKAMATHSSTLAWKIPWMEEPGRLQSMGSLRVRHD